jgi:hypothetical protein
LTAAVAGIITNVKKALMAHTACLVCLVSTVSGHIKTHSEKQVLVADTKQSKQANQADGLTWKAG